MSRNESLEPTSTLDKWLPTYKPTFKPMHEEHQSTAKINLQVELGDEVRIWSTGHFVVELVKRAPNPKNDKAYTFGFGVSSNSLAGIHMLMASISSTFFNFIPYASFFLILGFMGFNGGAFFSPDPIFEQKMSEYLSIPESTRDLNPICKLLGVCKIGEDESSQKLRLSLNSMFAYVNQSCTPEKLKIGQYKDKSFWVNVYVPELYSQIPIDCSRVKTHNCSSFFESFISSDLLKCAIINLHVPVPSFCRFGKELACDDCGTRDFLYASSKGGRKTKRRKYKRYL